MRHQQRHNLIGTTTQAIAKQSGEHHGVNQNEMLFKRGKALSGLTIRIGTSQLTTPPSKAGMNMKKIWKTA